MHYYRRRGYGPRSKHIQTVVKLEDLRKSGLDDREAGLQERKIIQTRRKEIEARRNLINAGSDHGAKELLALQEEVVTLQATIVQLQLDNAVEMNTLARLK